MTVAELKDRLSKIDDDRTVKVSVSDHGLLMVYDLTNVTAGPNSPAHELLWLEVR